MCSGPSFLMTKKIGEKQTSLPRKEATKKLGKGFRERLKLQSHGTMCFPLTLRTCASKTLAAALDVSGDTPVLLQPEEYSRSEPNSTTICCMCSRSCLADLQSREFRNLLMLATREDIQKHPAKLHVLHGVRLPWKTNHATNGMMFGVASRRFDQEMSTPSSAYTDRLSSKV
jgi:hypothetical protein